MANEEKGLASIGIKISINSEEIKNPTGIGDIGGDASELDTTTFNDEVSTSIPGVQKQSAWPVDYLYDNKDEDSDYRKLKALEDSKEIVPVTVTFPDGTVFANTGRVTTKITGVKVDSLLAAVANVSLQSKWAVTNPNETT